MSEKRFVVETVEITDCDTDVSRIAKVITDTDENYSYEDLYEVAKLLNEQQELIEELHISDHMGWGRAEKFEKKCSKELHNKKMYIKRLEYKVQKFKEENEQLRDELTFLDKVIGFFADNPMTKYSSKSELLEEMKLLEKMGLI